MKEKIKRLIGRILTTVKYLIDLYVRVLLVAIALHYAIVQLKVEVNPLALIILLVWIFTPWMEYWMKKEYRR